MKNARPITWEAIRLAAAQGYKYIAKTGVFIGKSGLKLSIGRRGTQAYPSMRLHVDGLPKTAYSVHAHKFAGFILFGEKVFGAAVRHLDGDTSNLLGLNLALGTHSQNEMDKPQSVRTASARAARAAQPHTPFNAKLSEDSVSMIRRELELNRGENGRVRRGVVKRLAKVHQVSASTISLVGKDKTWLKQRRNEKERAARKAGRSA